MAAFCFLGTATLPVYGQLFPELGGQRVGISGLGFLKIDVSPRSVGVGGASITLGGDAYGVKHNPALLTEVEHFSMAGSNTFWASGINYGFASAVKPFSFGTFGLSLGTLSSGALKVRTEFQPEGTGEVFYATYATAGLSYSQRLTEQFSYGLTVTYVYERLAQFSASTAIADLGFLYQTDFKDIRFAVVLQNFGLDSRLRGDFPETTSDDPSLATNPAPSTFKLGASMTVWEQLSSDQKLTAMVQLNHPNDNAENIRIGAEYDYKSLLFFRAGFRINVDDQPYPVGGLGVRMRVGRHPLRLDYAADPRTTLGIMHHVGLMFVVNPVE